MAHFAEIDDSNGVVLRVVVIANDDIKDGNGAESEAVGVAFCQALFGGGTWVQTSYNGTMRKNFAGRGYVYDAGRDAFIAPKPYASWVLDESTCQWQAPVALPGDGGQYNWHEDQQTWVAVNAD
jgi:hypothetical protein